jgi:hypothetical protein
MLTLTKDEKRMMAISVLNVLMGAIPWNKTCGFEFLKDGVYEIKIDDKLVLKFNFVELSKKMDNDYDNELKYHDYDGSYVTLNIIERYGMDKDFMIPLIKALMESGDVDIKNINYINAYDLPAEKYSFLVQAYNWRAHKFESGNTTGYIRRDVIECREVYSCLSK